MVSELMNTENKQWKSFEEQLQLLKSRGLLVDDEQAALDYLERIGYYRLSGYWYSFRQQEELPGDTTKSTQRKDEFIRGSHFKDAVKLYVFDKKLRLLALDALERVELAVRVDIAHLLGSKDIHAHENIELFNGHFSKQIMKKGVSKGRTKHQVWLARYHDVLRRARREPFVAHYNGKYGKLPIWVAVEVWDFGLMSKLYDGMKPSDKLVIANKYGAKDGLVFAGWLRSLNFIRNVSAHHSRLWNINVLERSALLEDDQYWKRLNNARPFYYFCLLKTILDVICPNSSWGERFTELLSEFPKTGSGSVTLRDFGLLDDWKNWSLWQKRKPTHTQE